MQTNTYDRRVYVFAFSQCSGTDFAYIPNDSQNIRAWITKTLINCKGEKYAAQIKPKNSRHVLSKKIAYNQGVLEVQRKCSNGFNSTHHY